MAGEAEGEFVARVGGGDAAIEILLRFLEALARHRVGHRGLHLLAIGLLGVDRVEGGERHHAVGRAVEVRRDLEVLLCDSERRDCTQRLARRVDGDDRELVPEAVGGCRRGGNVGEHRVEVRAGEDFRDRVRDRLGGLGRGLHRLEDGVGVLHPLLAPADLLQLVRLFLYEGAGARQAAGVARVGGEDVLQRLLSALQRAGVAEVALEAEHQALASVVVVDVADFLDEVGVLRGEDARVGNPASRELADIRGAECVDCFFEVARAAELLAHDVGDPGLIIGIGRRRGGQEATRRGGSRRHLADRYRSSDCKYERKCAKFGPLTQWNLPTILHTGAPQNCQLRQPRPAMCLPYRGCDRIH